MEVRRWRGPSPGGREETVPLFVFCPFLLCAGLHHVAPSAFAAALGQILSSCDSWLGGASGTSTRGVGWSAVSLACDTFGMLPDQNQILAEHNDVGTCSSLEVMCPGLTWPWCGLLAWHRRSSVLNRRWEGRGHQPDPSPAPAPRGPPLLRPREGCRQDWKYATPFGSFSKV